MQMSAGEGEVKKLKCNVSSLNVNVGKGSKNQKIKKKSIEAL